MRKIGQIGLIRPIVLALMLVLLTACGGGGSESISGGEVVPPPTNPEQGGGDPPYSAGPAMGFSAVCADSDEQGASNAPRRAMRRAAGDPQPGDGEFTTTDLQASGFGVYCWYTGNKSVPDKFEGEDHIKNYADTILMLNQKVEYINSLWTYSPTKYWPLNASEKLTLRAYAPYVSYQLQMDANGMPWMPVVVTKDDYHNGTQHDPLWGTNGESAKNEVGKHTYGALYDNYTYAMSGSSTSTHERDGTIDWYFHHGMSKLMFQCTVVKDPGCSSVTIKSITIEKLYTQGLLSLSSPTTQKNDKPFWKGEDWKNEPSGDMTVTLNGATTEDEGTTWTAGDLAPIPDPEHPENPHPTKPYPFVIDITESSETGPFNLLSKGKGLLIIPREFTSGNKLKLSLTYTIDNEAEEHTAKVEIEQKFEGNTTYTLKMYLTPSTEALEITMVQSAFTPWGTPVPGEHEVYNW